MKNLMVVVHCASGGHDGNRGYKSSRLRPTSPVVGRSYRSHRNRYVNSYMHDIVPVTSSTNP